jgi:hypothetical protein
MPSNIILSLLIWTPDFPCALITYSPAYNYYPLVDPSLHRQDLNYYYYRLK